MCGCRYACSEYMCVCGCGYAGSEYMCVCGCVGAGMRAVMGWERAGRQSH